MTELRDFGDGATIVLYTDERELATKLGNRKNCLKVIPYTQEQRKGEILVGIDYYFPKRERKALERLVNQQ